MARWYDGLRRTLSGMTVGAGPVSAVATELKALEAAIANTKDIAELVQKSSTEAFKIVQDRMKESYEEIRTSVEKKS